MKLTDKHRDRAQRLLAVWLELVSAAKDHTFNGASKRLAAAALEFTAEYTALPRPPKRTRAESAPQHLREVGSK
jgi:hypothetical protein